MALAYDEVELRGRAWSSEADLSKSSGLSLINEGVDSALVETNVRRHLLYEKAGTARRINPRLVKRSGAVRQANRRLDFTHFEVG
jgi:hypothetical protein